ncbi:DUF5597 domain-containing protein [Novosphingobium sp. SG720]|uniref:DUF5597 domain-containing protein n=1 Tax=Novosphingobium sp. SG720 TaxID=2586998 RepID=UPI0014453368|nr:DUF5597 domain-containing protein [Novosphingobium sp. SG720]NKJ44119.1 beta-galactosidase GanA [Novosphingobium sp. SG720]
MAILLAAVAAPALARPAPPPLPRVATSDGRPVLLVDGAPFLMLGAQANNSSNHASVLPQVWQTMAELGANTLEMPVAWAQIEPREGQFDFAFVDSLIAQARARNVRLVLLWFGTWKNGGPGYTPLWVKTDLARFPRKRDAQGRPLAALSPFAETTLTADRTAFVAVMRHLAQHDRDHRVMMVQVENEPGAFGIARDRSPAADTLFAQPVPAALRLAMHLSSGNWQQAFGPLADQAFMSWYTARYIDAIAAAGKAIKPLPMYCNAALSDPVAKTVDPQWISSGSPDWNMIPIWKVAAPHLDFVAPDIYTRDWSQVRAYLATYARPDNALMIPEIGNDAAYARFFWPALAHGAIGFAPFGMDATGYVNYPLGAKRLDAATIGAFAAKFRIMAPMARGWAAFAARHAGWGAAKDDDGADQAHAFGDWQVAVQFDRWMIGDESWTFAHPDPAPTQGRATGGAAIFPLDANSFLVVGSDVRLRFSRRAPQDAASWQYLSVEEGRLDSGGNWVGQRPWNGDQTDYGLNLPEHPVMLRVVLGALAP